MHMPAIMPGFVWHRQSDDGGARRLLGEGRLDQDLVTAHPVDVVDVPVAHAGHWDWQRPHSVQAPRSSMPFQVRSSTFPIPKVSVSGMGEIVSVALGLAGTQGKFDHGACPGQGGVEDPRAVADHGDPDRVIEVVARGGQRVHERASAGINFGYRIAVTIDHEDMRARHCNGRFSSEMVCFAGQDSYRLPGARIQLCYRLAIGNP
jgi:hypothetical protein